MVKQDLKLHAVVAPTQVVVASAYDTDGKPDACTLAFYMVSSHKPPCITIAINATQKRKTLKSILERKAFTVGFPSCTQVNEADYLGVESGYDADKLFNLGLTTMKAKKVDAPIINEFLLTLECQLIHHVTVGSHTQLTGAVKNIQADQSILNDQGKILLDKLQPIIYDEEQLSYLKIGDKISDAFKPGIRLKNSFSKR